MSNNCCGNEVCEADEYATCYDCGPFTISSPTPGSVRTTEGLMFDVEAINDIAVTGLTVIPGGTGFTVNIYTATGAFADKFSNASPWTKIIDGQSVTTAGEIFEFNFSCDFNPAYPKLTSM